MDAIELSKFGAKLDAFGGYAGAASHLLYGLQSKRAAEFEAEQLRLNAGQEQAAAQREAYSAELQSKLVASRALAVAAASGGGASDPTVVNIIAQDAAMGAYQKSLALYQGDDRARAMNMAADAKEAEGNSALVSSIVGTAGRTAKTYGEMVANEARTKSLYQRFGGDGPRVG